MGIQDRFKRTGEFNIDEGNLIVPDLELNIVNLWHFDDKVVPCDPDGITERHADIKSHDQYYVKESILITHYIDLIEKLIQLRNGGNNNYEWKKKLIRYYTTKLQNYTIAEIQKIYKKVHRHYKNTIWNNWTRKYRT